jgi:hypothetical protein
MDTLILVLAAVLVGGLLFRYLLGRFVLSAHKPRLQHYFFAHRLLPQTIFADPVAVSMPLIITATDRAKPDGVELLETLWQQAHLDPVNEPALPWDATRYEVTCLSHPNNMVIVIPLPAPEHKAEAYFAAIVIDSPGMAAGRIRQLRYFVLELSAFRGGQPKTFLAEWSLKDPDDMSELDYQIHFEDVPPTIPAFLEKIETLLPAKLPVPGEAWNKK